jgi:hypothetical protein
MKQFAFTILVGLVLSGLAMANITVTPMPTVTGSSPDFTWSYDVSLGSLETATASVPGGSCSGSTSTPPCNSTFFTIYDFAGYLTSTATAPSGWSILVQNVGFTPTGVSPGTGDSSSIANLTYYYTGANIEGPKDLGNFTAQSLYGTSQLGSYTAQSNSDPIGTVEHSVGSTRVPSVPEPSLTALIGLGLIGMALARRKFVL